MHAKSFQLCLTLCDPVDCSPPGSSVHGILQPRILEWVAMLSSRGSFQPRKFWDFPGGTMDKNPPANAGDSRIQPLVQEDSTCLGANKPMHQNYGAYALEPAPGASSPPESPRQVPGLATGSEEGRAGPRVAAISGGSD